MLNMTTAYAGFISEKKISPFQDIFKMGLTGDSCDGFWQRSSVIALKATAIYVINNAGADHESVKDDLYRSQWTQPEANEHRCNTLNIIKDRVRHQFVGGAVAKLVTERPTDLKAPGSSPSDLIP